MTTSKQTVVVIGYGTAAVNACIALRTGGYEGAIEVLSDTTTAPYSPIMTSYYAAGAKTREECFPWTEATLADLGATVHTGCTATRLDVAAHVVETTEGAFSYDKCLVASGAAPSTAGFPADGGFEPLVLRTMDDAERLKAALDDPACTRVLVSGTSMVALKMLEACLAHGKDCTLLGRSAHVLSRNALPEAAERFETGLCAQGVTLRLEQTAESAVPAADGAVEVAFSDGSRETFDAVCVAHGATPRLDFVEPGSLACGEGLLVDDFMRTSDPCVYAAGDVAQARMLGTDEKRIVALWKNAALQGACAGRAIAAELAGRVPAPEHAFAGALPANTIAVGPTLFLSAGAATLAEGRRSEVDATDEMTVVRVYEGERLVGYNVARDTDEEGGVAYDLAAMLTLRIEAGGC